MTLVELRALVTVNDLNQALDRQLSASLSYGDVDNAPYAVLAAARWGYGRLMGGRSADRLFSADELEVLKTALINRAVYELGRVSQFDDNFTLNREDADTMIDALLGLGSGSSEDGGGAKDVQFTGAVTTNYDDAKPVTTIAGTAACFRYYRR